MKKLQRTLVVAAIILLGISLIILGCDQEDDDSEDDTETDDDDNDDVTDDDTTSDDDDDDDDDDVLNPTDLIGNGYHLNMPLTAWTEPAGIGDVIGYFVPIILFGVEDAGAGFIDFLAGIGIDTEAKAIVQDECVVTTELPGGTLDEEGNFETGPHDFQMEIFGLDAILYDTMCSGKINTDGTEFSGVEFGGMMDIRHVIDLFFYDEDQVCALASAFGTQCVACPSDGEEYCVSIKAEAFKAELVSDLTIQEITPADIGPECDDDDDDDDVTM